MDKVWSKGLSSLFSFPKVFFLLIFEMLPVLINYRILWTRNTVEMAGGDIYCLLFLHDICHIDIDIFTGIYYGFYSIF